MFERKRAFLAAGDGGGGVTIQKTTLEAAMAEGDDEAQQTPAGFDPLPLDDGDVEYVPEGDPRAFADEPEAVRGKSREELAETVRKTQEELERERAARTSGADALAQALKGILPQQTPAAPVEGYRIPVPAQQNSGKTAQELKAEAEQRFITDPITVMNELVTQQLGPVVAKVVENQTRLGRKLALSDPENKKVYDRYAAEVEQFVANTPVATRVEDPEIYQKAVASVKSAHISEFMQESVQAQVDAAVAAALKQYGITPGQVPAGKAPVTGARTNPQAAPSPTKRVVQIPQYIIDEANRTGKNPGSLYEFYKSTGRAR